MTLTLTIGVLALQGAFIEHLRLLHHAATDLALDPELQTETARGDDLAACEQRQLRFEFVEVRTATELARCHGLVIPGGASRVRESASDLISKCAASNL